VKIIKRSEKVDRRDRVDVEVLWSHYHPGS